MRRRIAVIAASAAMMAGAGVVAAPAASAHTGIGFHVYNTQQECVQGLIDHVRAGQWRVNCIGFLNTPYILFHY
ncbi:hypothetical protein ONR57_13280 [Hoyosella sp. YIM 151337]|uniref:hypothetical protein n=1 Tax=Hoyosella sp. YIM 151337 TaxID=2992742 RepID=UPI002236AC78|nr:hypothetical protein [Hoyosella sp. YIM 151337]MCW4354273.1 hypothetical protein [Hoyosella sp. YIM 151337]